MIRFTQKSANVFAFVGFSLGIVGEMVSHQPEFRHIIQGGILGAIFGAIFGGIRDILFALDRIEDRLSSQLYPTNLEKTEPMDIRIKSKSEQ